MRDDRPRLICEQTSWPLFRGTAALERRGCLCGEGSRPPPEPACNMGFRLHRGDLPDDITFSGAVAIDTETMGLNPHRDRLCLVQISGGDGNAELVQIQPGQTSAP